MVLYASVKHHRKKAKKPEEDYIQYASITVHRPAAKAKWDIITSTFTFTTLWHLCKISVCFFIKANPCVAVLKNRNKCQHIFFFFFIYFFYRSSADQEQDSVIYSGIKWSRFLFWPPEKSKHPHVIKNNIFFALAFVLPCLLFECIP